MHSIEVTLIGLSSDFGGGILALEAVFLVCNQNVIRNPKF
jgi:hypothetical protein